MRKQHQLIQLLFIVTDAVSVGVAWLLAYYVRFSLGIIPIYRGTPPFSMYAVLLVLVVPVWLVSFRFNRLYALRRGESLGEDILNISRGGILATFFLAGLSFFYRSHSFSRLVIVIFLALGVVFCSINRAVLLQILGNLRRRGINVRRVLIIGAGELARTVAGKIREYPGLGLRVEGFIASGNGGENGLTPPGEILGALPDLRSLVRERRIDQVLIALPRDAHKMLEVVFKALEHEMVEINVVPDLLGLVALRTGLEDLDGIPIINLSHTPLSGWYGPVKRAADICFSMVGILLTAPLMLLIALAIKITSRGPVLYRQERMGLDGTIFTMYKFRSMREDAETETGAVWASENDPRRTRLGAFLRHTSLDELPQLFNVFKGEMSLVGPRPERPFFVDQFKEKIPRYMLRHRVKCGLTGWAQVHGYRGNTSLEKRIEHDLFYIENWSLSLDVLIIWLTVWKGLINRNAY